MHIVAFAGSSSRQSINKRLVTYAVKIALDEIVPRATADILDLNDFEMPLFSVDRERDIGIPEAAQAFRERINGADALIISLAEHNGSFAAAYKNLFDWASRLEGKVYADRPAVLLSTSPGGRGGASVMEQARKLFPYWGGRELGHLSIPKFHEVFDAEAGQFKDKQWADDLRMALSPLAEVNQAK